MDQLPLFHNPKSKSQYSIFLDKSQDPFGYISIHPFSRDLLTLFSSIIQRSRRERLYKQRRKRKQRTKEGGLSPSLVHTKFWREKKATLIFSFQCLICWHTMRELLSSFYIIQYILLIVLFLPLYTQSLSFNYSDALSKSLLYFEAQRSGHLPYNQRVKWRGHSGLTDGLQQGVSIYLIKPNLFYNMYNFF